MPRIPYFAAALVILCLSAAPLRAENRVPVLFLLFGAGDDEVFIRTPLWQEVVDSFAPEFMGEVVYTADPRVIVQAVDDANDRNPATASVGIATVMLDKKMTPEEFEAWANTFEDELLAGSPQMSSPAQAVQLVQEPTCRAIQFALEPGHYVSQTVVIIPRETEPARRCIETVAQTIFRRAQGQGLDTSGREVDIVDETADAAQAAMGAMRIVSDRLVTDIKSRERRDSNIYQVGEKVEILVNLHDVARSDPGRPTARYRVKVDIQVERSDGAKKLIEDAGLYEGEVAPSIPVDAIYFQNWATAGIQLNDPGEYTLTFIFTDLYAAPDKRMPVRARFDVVVLEAGAPPPKTGSTDL